VNDEAVASALRELRASVEGLRAQLESLRGEGRQRDAELSRLREELADREARIRGLGEQALHLLDLVHELRAERAAAGEARRE
jgi:hypothetical protein